MSFIFSFSHQKGGVAKTTTTISLGAHADGSYLIKHIRKSQKAVGMKKYRLPREMLQKGYKVDEIIEIMGFSKVTVNKLFKALQIRG